MSAFDEKLVQLKLKKKEIEQMGAELHPKVEALKKEFDEKVKELDAQYVEKINALKLPFDNAVAQFRAEQKAFCGLADGEKIEIFDVIEAIRKVKDMA